MAGRALACAPYDRSREGRYGSRLRQNPRRRFGDRVSERPPGDQVRPVPFVMLDFAQPNFLVPEAGGERALRGVFSASLGPEFEAYRATAR